MEIVSIGFQQRGSLILARLPPEMERDPALLRNARIMAADSEGNAFLVTENATFEIRWLLSSNSAFLLDASYTATQIFDRELEMTRVKPDFSLFYQDYDKIASSAVELAEFSAMCFPVTVPTVSQISYAIVRAKCMEAPLQQLCEELADIFSGKFDFSRQISWLCAEVDGKYHQYPNVISGNPYLKISPYRVVSSIVQGFCYQKKVFLFQQLAAFYESLNIPKSLSLYASALQEEEIFVAGKLALPFYIEIIRFKPGQLWGCLYGQKAAEGSIVRYYQRDTLSFDLKKRLYFLLGANPAVRFDELVSACDDCSFETVEKVKQFVWEEEDSNGDVWCGCRPFYEFLQ